jgi:hypothetical protein
MVLDLSEDLRRRCFRSADSTALKGKRKFWQISQLVGGDVDVKRKEERSECVVRSTEMGVVALGH